MDWRIDELGVLRNHYVLSLIILLLSSSGIDVEGEKYESDLSQLQSIVQFLDYIFNSGKFKKKQHIPCKEVSTI